MVKLLKYEMKKQQTSRMVIGSILLVCVLGFALGMLLGREKLAAVKSGSVMMATLFVVFYVGIESILVLNQRSEDEAELYALDGSKVHLGDSWIKIPCSDPADADRLCDVCGSRTDLYPGHITAYRTFE